MHAQAGSGDGGAAIGGTTYRCPHIEAHLIALLRGLCDRPGSGLGIHGWLGGVVVRRGFAPRFDHADRTK